MKTDKKQVMAGIILVIVEIVHTMKSLNHVAQIRGGGDAA